MNKFFATCGYVFVVACTGAMSCTASPIVTRVRIGNGSGRRGTLFITIGQKERKIADNVEKAKRIAGGRMVAFDQFIKTATGDQKIDAFKIFDAATGRIRTIISPFDEGEQSLQELKTSSGKTRLALVQGSASGSPFLYIIDPLRGVVFHPKQPANVIARQGDILTIGFFTPGDAPPDNKPVKIKKVNLAKMRF